MQMTDNRDDQRFQEQTIRVKLGMAPCAFPGCGGHWNAINQLDQNDKQH